MQILYRGTTIHPYTFSNSAIYFSATLLYASCGTSDSQFQQGGGTGFPLIIPQPDTLMIFVFKCMYTRAHNKFKYVELILDIHVSVYTARLATHSAT